ncbi:hypothetical protein PCASD_01206 [Puccinia coronata f. sp. avenae]|uniref:Uncharacterized protein n=1 Tax=Puccinia coronata f. sp. avenae TaxID=200324 RepID=A0A2N5VLN9_9BASI|nr:hypothetical protein PCASD_01206 [Puccinia coronata f. sp. avenae]
MIMGQFSRIAFLVFVISLQSARSVPLVARSFLQPNQNQNNQFFSNGVAVDQNGNLIQPQDQNGFGQNGFGQNGFGQNGFDPNGFGQTGSAKTGSAKTGSAKTGSAKTGSAKTGLGILSSVTTSFPVTPTVFNPARTLMSGKIWDWKGRASEATVATPAMIRQWLSLKTTTVLPAFVALLATLVATDSDIRPVITILARSMDSLLLHSLYL